MTTIDDETNSEKGEWWSGICPACFSNFSYLFPKDSTEARLNCFSCNFEIHLTKDKSQ